VDPSLHQGRPSGARSFAARGAPVGDPGPAHVTRPPAIAGRSSASTRFGPLEVGATFAGYRIDAPLGRGGMGVVFRATQIALERTVALKVLGADVGDEPAFRARFRREQQVMASVQHPNVLPVYDVGEHDGLLYIAMQYVDGPTLKQIVTGEAPLEPARAAHLVAQVAAGLDAAHTHGLVHRDVKPQNVLTTSRGGREHAFLADFGLAVQSRDTAQLTRTGQLLGTLDYVAPELIRGMRGDARMDIYALGCVLFEVLVGAPPFVRPSEVATLWAHLQDPPPRPSERRRDLGPHFDEVIERALAKDPDDRYPSAGSLAHAAQEAARGVTPTPPPPSPARVLGAPALAAAPPAEPDDRFVSMIVACPRGFIAPPPADEPAEPASLAPAAPPSPPPPAIRAPSGSADEQPGADPWDAPSRATTFVARPSPTARFRLRDGFRYVHEPVADDAEGLPILGNERVIAALKQRIVHSTGGSFLLTGFRGVGKTTVIARTLAEMEVDDPSGPILAVSLNVARPRSVAELLFEVIRRLFERLQDEKLLERMPEPVQREMLLAYARTSLSFNETRTNVSEKTRTLGVSTSAALLDALAPKLEVARRTTDSLATQASFLAYSDADVEHDFLRIVSLMARGEPPRPAPRRRWRRRSPADVNGAVPAAWRGKLVVVFDELDKLTATSDGQRCLRELICGLKNLLTARGVHFIFVGGPDLHDLALEESHRGNSVYQSVFGWQSYVPCLWRATDRLLDALVTPDARGGAQLEALRDHLAFKARGVPRLLLMELNSFVRWDEDEACLELARDDIARVEFYAGLERTLGEFLHRHAARPFAVPIDDDRWRLGAYYLVDWILRSDGASFTVEELVDRERDLTIDPIFALSSRKVEALLEHLRDHGVVELVRGRTADQTFYGDVPTAQVTVYRLARDIAARLAGFARINERERADLAAGGANQYGHAQPWADSEVAGVVGGGRYELLDEVDRGGMGMVYRARDKLLQREVAVKVLAGDVVRGDERVRGRFRRKGAIAKGVSHPHIVTTHDTFEEDGRLGIVMEFAAGTSLEQLLAHARLTAREAVKLAVPLADALEHLEQLGIVRLDLKPSSILVDGRFRPLIIDLGLAKVVRERGDSRDALTAEHTVLGTPAYAAPEQLRGEPPDIRADIYSLGLILFEMLAGRPARGRGDLPSVLARAAAERIDASGLRASDGLRAAVAQALAPDPDERFAHPAAFRDALAATDEARTGG
jgi:serine/threonine protein kinase